MKDEIEGTMSGSWHATGAVNGAFTPKKAGAAQIHKVKTRTRLEAHFCKKNLCMS